MHIVVLLPVTCQVVVIVVLEMIVPVLRHVGAGIHLCPLWTCATREGQALPGTAVCSEPQMFWIVDTSGMLDM